jgi:protein required for attachment to host cells
MRDLEKHESAHEHTARTFAKELADIVDRGRTDGRFGRVVLVAEPHFLGLLRGSLSTEVTKMVEASVSKDLANVAIRDLGPHLEGVVRR